MVRIWTAALIQGFVEVCSKWVLLLLPGKGLSDLKKRAEARAPQMYTDLVTFQFQQSPPSPYTLTFPSVASVWFFIALAKANTFLRGHGNFLLPLKKAVFDCGILGQLNAWILDSRILKWYVFNRKCLLILKRSTVSPVIDPILKQF